ncbi:MAG: TCR/Tet family MFS transporter [Polyangiaceae bacterium]|nr:TCR/Tet family MFS transporter [Polyangiaceae bacterium]
MSELQPPRQHGRKSYVFVLVTVAIDMIGFGLIMPVTPSLIAELTGLSLDQAAPWGGYLAALYAVLNFLAGPTLGNLSDRYGRRPVLLVAMAALGANFLLMGLATSIALLFVGRVLSGIAGATMSTASAYIADVTEPERRAQAFGGIGAAFGIGFVLGPVLGGVLGELHVRAPFFVAAGLSLVNVLYGAFVLPESLPPERRRPFVLARANPLGAFRHFSKLPQVSLLIVTMVLFQFCQMLFLVIWAFFTELRFGWDARAVGVSLGLVGVSAAVVQGVLIGPVLRRLGPTQTALVAMAFGVVTLLAYAFITESWMVYVLIFLSAPMGMAPAAINSITSSRVDANAQGELQGAVASANAFGTMLSPLVMTQTFAYFSRPEAPVRFFGAPFVVAALVMAIAVVPFVVGVRRSRA